MSDWNNLDELQKIIEFGYQELGYEQLDDRGYRFLSSPQSTLWSDRLILSINPAGNTPDFANDSMFTSEGVSAYVDERWMAAPVGSSKLQIQYRKLFDFLGWEPLEVLQAPFSPFRHPSWSKIPSRVREATIEFCVSNIWEPYFSKHCPSKIISVGRPPATSICQAFPFKVTDVSQVATGWNNAACDTASIYRFENGTVMVQIPHLSRFGIMTAPSCQPFLKDIFSPLISNEAV